MGLPGRASSVGAVAAALLLAAGCGGSRITPSPPSSAKTPFSYDASTARRPASQTAGLSKRLGIRGPAVPGAKTGP